MPLTPQEVRDSLSLAAQLSVASLTGKIDSELLRSGFTGPGELRISLAPHLTESVRNTISRSYRSWRSTRWEEEGGIWVFCLGGSGE